MSNNNDYTTGNSVDFAYYKENYKLIAIDLSKQTKIKDPQQINFIGKIEGQNNGVTMFFIIETSEETTFEFSQKSVISYKTFIDEADFINTIMSMYNLIEYSVNYSSTSGSPWHFGRDEIINNEDVTNDDNAPSFKHKASLIDNTGDDGTKNRVKIAVPLKYLYNFWRPLEMPLINC